MGNSDQGCACMRPRERKVAPDTWKNQFSEDFELLFRKGFKWAESICALLILWDSKLDKLFRSTSRWQFFLSNDCDKSGLDYQINPIHKNLFKELEIDLKDNRNPLAAAIVQFIQSYTLEVHDEVRSIVLEGTEEDAKKVLENIMEDIKTVIEIFVRGSLNFYTCIFRLLKHKGSELKGLFLTLIISGDLYRLIYDLSVKLNKNLCGRVSSLSLVNKDTDMKVVHILRQISVCESPYEKLLYLFELKLYLLDKNLSESELTSFVWTHIIESKIRDIFVHLYLIDLFALEPMDSSFEYFLESLEKIESM